MPYACVADLPEAVRAALPHRAQLIYRATFNNAWFRGTDEAGCHRIAWAAVKRQFHKVTNSGWQPIERGRGE
jgi:cation transport regulator ChaB